MKHTVAVIGSGNWGTAVAKLLASNIIKKEDFNEIVYMWTYEEKIDGRNLTSIINDDHENVKYLPGIKLPNNLFAEPDIMNCIEFADILVFVVPHQFVKSIIKEIKPKVLENKKAYTTVSLIKGVIFENNELTLISDYISKELNVDCGVLMGANIADEVASGCISEGTLACRQDHHKNILLRLFNSYTYRVTAVSDIVTVELCGILKNIVSIAYGIGIGKGYSVNTTVAILRNGLNEMVKFIKIFYGCDPSAVFESSGIADLFVSCISGRNYKCGIQLASNKTIEEVESQMGGQKLQGTLTSKEIHGFLNEKEKLGEFPLFNIVYQICFENEMCDSILEVISSSSGVNR